MKVTKDYAATLAAINTALTFQHQTDAAITQVNPVSDTVYNVLPATANVRIVGAHAKIVWGVTQPTNMRLIVTIDGHVLTYTAVAPISGDAYRAISTSNLAPTAQLLLPTSNTNEEARAFLLEGRSVQIDVAVTWGVTQPSPLSCGVIWAKR